MIRILLLGLVLAGVWYLYRMVTQQNASGGAAVTPANDKEPVAPPLAEAPAADTFATDAPSEAMAASEQASALEREASAADAEEMIECPVCQAYVPETAHDGCGRPDCPIPALAEARQGEGRPGPG
ncbi:hypothetical protein [Elioraea rosea]|uniref:hypothetical protein n=1 Tax=Elioraea rosea TaxID=2492390 RepID=UPI001183B687|nr:hypothetical protein [Elioraea rosea]